MKHLFLTILLSLGASAISAGERYDIVPRPADYVTADGAYTLKSTDAKRVAKLITDKSMVPESYVLEVSPKAVTIKAADATGHFYGQQTLAQMISQATDGQLDCCVITDSPRFGYRGLMLDVVRCYIEPSEIKRIIDAAAMLKINNLHLHLTDDNGWRMEIKKYPELTEVGAWRADRPELFPGRLNVRSADEPTTYGGFYTQRELRDIVKYAADRHINVIPEIEMPAHAAAAIASYPNLACPVVDKYVGVFPGIGGKDASIIMCAGNDDVYTFYQDVIDEVISVFPSEYIHLGGDEANKAMWKKCPKCNARIEAEGLDGYEELQAYFMDRINHYVHSKGRKTMGWDEVTYGNPKEDMVIMGWQGDGGVAVRDALKSGRKFIMTPARTTYLIRYQGPQWFEPFTYFGNNTLLDIHDYEPLSPELADSLSDQLLGVQGSLWTEFCRTPEDVQYLIFPRLLAVADMAWRQKGDADWQSFLNAVDNVVPVLEDNGITVARSMYNLDHKVVPSDGKLKVGVSNIRPDMEIRYSVNDSTFTSTYTDTIVIDSDCTVYASTFADGEQMGRTLALPLSFNKATGRQVTANACNNGLASVLTNGLRGSDRNSDFEWAGWHNGTAEFVVDLGEVMPVNSVSLGALVNSDICISAPTDIFIYLSDDNYSYSLAKHISVSNYDLFAHPAKIIDFASGPLDSSARYIKVVTVNPGCVPDEMAREGTPTWMYFDEISVD